MKETFYFSHDYNARNDEKILELRAKFGAEGYGVYWMLIETMAENPKSKLNLDLIGGLSLGYGIPKDTLSAIIDFLIKIDLFVKNDNFIFSTRLLKHKNFRKKLSDAGKDGARKRWNSEKRCDSPDGNRVHSPAIAPLCPTYAKERKGKESKEKYISSFAVGKKKDTGKYIPKTDNLSIVVYAIKIATGVKIDDMNWDKTDWGRAVKSAKELLTFFDNDKDMAVRCIEDLVADFERRELAWKSETICRWKAEWRRQMENGGRFYGIGCKNGM